MLKFEMGQGIQFRSHLGRTMTPCSGPTLFFGRIKVVTWYTFGVNGFFDMCEHNQVADQFEGRKH